MINRDLFWKMIESIDTYFEALPVGTIIAKDGAHYKKFKTNSIECESGQVIHPSIEWRRIGKGFQPCLRNSEMVNGVIITQTAEEYLEDCYEDCME